MAAGIFKSVRLLAGTYLAALGAAPLAHAQTSPFRPERFDEDWSTLAPDGAPYGAQFKNIEIIDGVDVSFGGDARWRYSMLDAPRLGIGTEQDSWILQRLLLHADLRFEDNARIFVQLGAHDGIDRELPASTDDDEFDVQQAFFDLSAPLAGGRVTFRAGRQELSLGPRFVTTRDSGNVRQRHDLARLIYERGHWRADIFGGSPVSSDQGAFDDQADESQDLYGLRLQRALGPASLDVYAYELDRDTATLTGVTANDDRISLGARFSGRAGEFDYDSEVMVQRGSFGGQDIRAVGSMLDIGRRFPESPLSPRIGARFTYGSGDSDLSDSSQGTFAPPFPNSQWFGQNGLASYSNTIETAALFGLAPVEDVSLNIKVSSLWRAETADYVYAGSTALTGTSSGEETYVGTSAAFSLNWRPNENVSINPYVSYVAVGDELTTRGAHDVTYAHLTVTLRF
ncbi:hypothetical protein ATE48_18015 [Candidatus Viadribacter manganicus]|uniref:Alginate export domain-containing protein n=1 Tax=Candidatus Viadribacter manganicus TaxID=1759059 RepID=A0A1B1AMB4_9PROT|nr:hypothetical protein ATE48_18015 [Candidatus Viadribacter manganicus]